jgi:hypothetical protein
MFQIISHSNFLKRLKYLKFDQNYRDNHKDLWHQTGYYENIINEFNDTYLASQMLLFYYINLIKFDI